MGGQIGGYEALSVAALFTNPTECWVIAVHLRKLIILRASLPPDENFVDMISRRAVLTCFLCCLAPFGVASTKRKSYQVSCLILQRMGLIDKGPLPPLPNHRPNYDDAEPLGVNFFRTQVANVNLSNLTLPRTYFGRTELVKVNFENTDLSESTLCWNDFVKVNFSHATLLKADLRASSYLKVRFDYADLRGSDLRRSSFHECSFVGANLTNAIASRKQAASLPLSEKQHNQISWLDDDGVEPDGG